jgi:hypothetical protein
MSLAHTENQPIERIGLKGPIEFNKTPYYLAWSDKPNATYYVQEYLPKNETVERFNQMITVNVFVMDVSVEEGIQQKVVQLTKRKETDRVCVFNVIKSPDPKESILDCVLSLEKDGELDVAEFIIYRYKQIELENHQKALLIYSYSKRSYGKDIPAFLKNVSTERSKLLNMMMTKELPNLKIKE